LHGCFLSHFTLRFRHVTQERAFAEIGESADVEGGEALWILLSGDIVGPRTEDSSAMAGAVV
jgi:hypothetical protein